MGSDKAWLDLGGRPVISWLLEALRGAFDSVMIIANEPQPWTTLGLPVKMDLRPGHGPLAGLETALAAAGREAIFVVACDMPFVTADFAFGLAQHLPGHDAVVPWSQKGPEPLCAFYSPQCLPAVGARLDRGQLKTADFLAEVAVKRIEGADLAELDPRGIGLLNLNRPEDYQRARRLLDVWPAS
jgi:molybdopterin-guanine dinucleotide biosynthesis protein A